MSALSVSATSARRAPRRAKVLVAEDHEDTRQLLRALLEKRGLSVVEAGDGFEAVDAAERERPDLILMDSGLPLLDGIAATRRLRNLPALSAIPIVFLSGHAGPQAQTAARAAGCDEYVVKPFNIARLDTVLNRHLPGHGGHHHEEVLTDAMTQPEIRASIRSGAVGLSRGGAPMRKLFGLAELDSAGTVLYTRFEADGGAPPDGGAPDYTGLNFYTEVAPFRNVVEFRNLIDGFSRGSQPAHSTDFTCDYEDGPLLVRVLLARIRERSQADTTKSILVHIRRAR
jgi:CheY-like chemotaxis protein